MTDELMVTQLSLLPDSLLPPKKSRKWPDLNTFWRQPERLPVFVCTSPTVMRCLELLGPLDWSRFPERDLERNWGHSQIPYAALAAAELLKLNEGLKSLGHLHLFLSEHPGFIWLLGFPLQPAPRHPLGFNVLASLPTPRHFTRMLRSLPNATLQFLLADSVRLIVAELATLGVACGDCVSLDTKHILAWVKVGLWTKWFLSDSVNLSHIPSAICGGISAIDRYMWQRENAQFV
jgi:hypothetical protein